MADENPAPETKKSSDKKIFILLAALFMFLAVAYALSLGPLDEPAEIEVTEEQVEAIEDVYAGNSTEDVLETADAALSGVEFDINIATKERVLGDTPAPIKIAEHSSLTCGHCGNFHKDTFKTFKANYIDSGRAYLVFSDFPLNAPALHATMAARCVAEDRYFDFLQELFENQDAWAYERNYMELLQARAANYGLDKDNFEACIQNEELQAAILKRVQGVQSQWEIRSTPSFVVNNQVVISGALSYEEFDAAIQNALAEIAGEDTANEDPETE